MPKRPTHGILVVLEQTIDVTLKHISDDCVRVHFRNKYWHIWLVARCWVECDENDSAIGIMHYGSADSFYNKEIAKKPNIPKNHLKRWELNDLKMLTILAKANTTIAEAAIVLQRTEWSVVSKFASEYGIKIDNLMRSPALGATRFKSIASHNYAHLSLE